MEAEEELEKLKTWSCPEVCHYLAMKVRKYRQHARISQAEFAQMAGIPLRTYKRFETRGRANLETFIEVLRVMERTHYLFMLFPSAQRAAPTISLEERLKGLTQRVHSSDVLNT